MGNSDAKSNSQSRDFDKNLDQTRIAIPLLNEMAVEAPTAVFDVILDLNLFYEKGRGLEAARGRAESLVGEVLKEQPTGGDGWKGVDVEKSKFAYQHLFARLSRAQIEALATKLDKEKSCPVHKIWPDAEVEGQLTESLKVVKADAAFVAFGADGNGICWAVIDSGIDGKHPHFAEHQNLELKLPLKHVDFTTSPIREIRHDELPEDPNGHGTHVAGIIAGKLRDPEKENTVVSRTRTNAGDADYTSWKVKKINGVAPRCKLVSLRVLDENNRGKVSNIIAALGYIDQMNRSAQWPQIHGVNLSVGYEFDAEWFGCGQSPLCVEVNRIVRSGTPVVTAAGNTGYGKIKLDSNAVFRTGLPLSINDPGNAELAITVGSTHREKPHTYGVSYFSSKGPTGDGRLKPDLVAPGERIISCAAGTKADEMAQHVDGEKVYYREESGTSMAAPHVSGAIASFLSIRSEFIGEPERVKEILLTTCTDLQRERYFQGRGLLDLMRAIQSV